MIPRAVSDITIKVKDLYHLSDKEISSIKTVIDRCNMALYQSETNDPEDKSAVLRLGEQLGLTHIDRNLLSGDDSISVIKNTSERTAQDFIPYTRRSMNWHTDGYYNTSDRTIRGMILHCASSAQDGGETLLYDPELIYLFMMDKNPDLVSALMEEDVLCIPEYRENNGVIRNKVSGSVFNTDSDGFLNMRYTERKKYVLWKKDKTVDEAIRFITQLLNEDSRYHVRVRLKPGEGVVCNNVVHRRNAFVDGEDSQRVLYRARYYDRIMPPSLNMT